MLASVFSINVSLKKGEAKERVQGACLKDNFGLLGDAHAGRGLRQVSLLAWEEMERFIASNKVSGVSLRPGIFAENITTRGVKLAGLKRGDKIAIGPEAVLEVTQIGKACHDGCVISQQIGSCLMPRQGVFARVARGGQIKVCDEIRLELKL
jgi:MOSC domain-containing protein YiiM